MTRSTDFRRSAAHVACTAVVGLAFVVGARHANGQTSPASPPQPNTQFQPNVQGQSSAPLQGGPLLQPQQQPPSADLASAYANSVGAQAAYDQARANFNITIIRLNKQFESSDGYKQAISNRDLAQADVDRIRAGIVAQLLNDPEYREDIDARNKLGTVLADQPNLPQRDRVELALSKLHYAQEASQWESSALGQSPELKSAQARLIDASRRVIALRTQFDNNLYRDPTWQAAKRTVDQSSLAMITTNAYFQGVLQMRDDAINTALLNAQAPRVYSFPNSGCIGPYPILTGGVQY